MLLDGLVDARRGVGLADMGQQKRHGHDRRGGIGDALARDVGRAAMHGFEHRRIRPRRIDIAAGRQPDAAGHRGGEIGDDVAEQIVGHDDVEPARISNHVDSGGVDVLVSDLDVGIVPADLADHPRPQLAGVRQHVGLVYQRHVLAPLAARANA